MHVVKSLALISFNRNPLSYELLKDKDCVLIVFVPSFQSLALDTCAWYILGPFIYSGKKHILNAYFVSVLVLGSGATMVNKIDGVLAQRELAWSGGKLLLNNSLCCLMWWWILWERKTGSGHVQCRAGLVWARPLWRSSLSRFAGRPVGARWIAQAEWGVKRWWQISLCESIAQGSLQNRFWTRSFT